MSSAPPAQPQPQTTLDEFQWAVQPLAERLVHDIVDDAVRRSPFAAELKRRLRDETGTRLFDWVDHLVVPDVGGLRESLRNAGFIGRFAPGAGECFTHEEGMFPAILPTHDGATRLAIKVESVADFLSVWQITPPAPVQGEPLSPLRRAMIASENDVEIWIIERHAHRGFNVPALSPETAVLILKHAEAFRTRRRFFTDESDAFAHANVLIDVAIADLGVDRACDLFFAAERENWQRRNRAAQVQKARQDRLGLGWANHDHHTYRSSREHFAALIAVFEKLGFHCRERFYAGKDAGWGAQVLEQPAAGVVIFADVDLSPDEVLGDFSHAGLPPRKALGTVGLWCALHGEAFLEAGMHHLECQFDFEALKKQMEGEFGVRVMKPFTDFPHLRQAFTEGETWPVRPQRIDRLASAGRITPEQAKQFREKGALGSHLENLERNQGFKGFNQTGISEIIARTDPRAQHARSITHAGS
jgi:hypothetical protein